MPRESLPSVPDHDSDRDINVEVPMFVQWVANGPGFVPSTKSIQNIPAGVYDLQWINEVPTFVQSKVVADDLVALPDSKSDEVIREIKRFWSLAPSYKKHGYNHKRGFLLHGPPGSGKTSTVIAVIQQVVKDNGVVVLAGGKCSPSVLNTMLQRFRGIEGERPLLVTMEDLDGWIKDNNESEILALLDGESSLSNVVFLATTNYPEELDGRVTNRPSRFDRVVEIGTPNAEARLIYFKSRGLGLTDQEYDEWVDATKGLSIAHCKELVIATACLGETFDEAISRLRGMKKTPSSQGDKSVGFTQ